MAYTKTCSVPGCGRPHRSRGYCALHYTRWLSNGDPNKVQRERQPKPRRMCSIDNCQVDHYAHGVCRIHYDRLRAHGDAGGSEVQHDSYRDPQCTVDGCDRPHEARGLCVLHYHRWTNNPDLDVDDPSWIRVPSYTSVHQRMRRIRGKASAHQCVHCTSGAAQWAYDYSDPIQYVTGSGLAYSSDVSRYIPLCVECHRRHDVANRLTFSDEIPVYAALLAAFADVAARPAVGHDTEAAEMISSWSELQRRQMATQISAALLVARAQFAAAKVGQSLRLDPAEAPRLRRRRNSMKAA